VVVCLCGCVVVWLCGCVVVWLCGCVVVWLCVTTSKDELYFEKLILPSTYIHMYAPPCLGSCRTQIRSVVAAKFLNIWPRLLHKRRTMCEAHWLQRPGMGAYFYYNMMDAITSSLILTTHNQHIQMDAVLLNNYNWCGLRLRYYINFAKAKYKPHHQHKHSVWIK